MSHPKRFHRAAPLIAQTAEEFAVNEIVPKSKKWNTKISPFPRSAEKAGDLGLSAVEIPEAYGGLEMDKVTAAIIADHLAQYAGFATTWGAHTASACDRSFYFGREEQKKKDFRLGSGGDGGRLCAVGGVFRIGMV